VIEKLPEGVMMIMIKVILVCVCLYAHIVDSFQKRFI